MHSKNSRSFPQVHGELRNHLTEVRRLRKASIFSRLDMPDNVFRRNPGSKNSIDNKKKPRKATYFAVCINNEHYEASLELGKLYRIIPDEKAESRGYICVLAKAVKIMVILRLDFFDWKFPNRWRKL